MKLAFTTLGCPNWDMDTIISKAVENGYDGVDFRGYLGEMDIYKLPEFSSDIETTKRKFAEADLEIPCFSSSIRLFTTSNSELEHFKEELRQYGHLCQSFDTPYIRVFGGKIGDTPRSEAIQMVKDNLDQLLPIAEKFEVTLIVETHDDWTKCEHVEEVLNLTHSKYVQVLWDVHHPYRTMDEEPEKTWDMLGKRIKYTHWKDSYPKEATARGYQLCLMGDGDIPLKRIFDLLDKKGYEGYYTLEWEKVWCPEIEEPEIAIPQYVQYMHQLRREIE
ncbi:sugar phosphate isomerase/epimerase [Lederbergia sp. NSJ-179]|uniref:sugar phosphate isomerase/epimerase family protein n=1 Tax=Lederbergia sp. NSJ-179 TaxID=2931402 RepID=UPI001FD2C50D|nr:sugar phosphate isomerase/epimerase family protein [Lederbergia sp. NSJ-179]MCJ7839843.1 sugar phosphate isomerase/epimerase [Lederbergia sp. NSJ-179]